jgi:hypothetical protein
VVQLEALQHEVWSRAFLLLGSWSCGSRGIP